MSVGPNYFHDRLDGLGARMKALNAPVAEISYVRGSTTVLLSDVTIGKTQIENLLPNSDILIEELWDYIFDYDQIEDTIVEPKVGDRFVDADGTTVAEVVTDGNDHCYRWTSATRKRIRVHTKIVVR